MKLLWKALNVAFTVMLFAIALAAIFVIGRSPIFWGIALIGVSTIVAAKLFVIGAAIFSFIATLVTPKAKAYIDSKRVLNNEPTK